MADVIARIGARRIVNAAGALTRLGGAVMSPAVADAMAQAAQCSASILELQAAASRRLAEVTGAEAGLVTTGASAALTLAAAAVLAGLDPARMERLPDAMALPGEIIMARTHRTGYDRALRTAGAQIRDVGVNDRGTGAGIRGLEPWEIEAAIGPRTAAIAFSANRDTLGELGPVVRVAERHGLPVIVDAAAQLPPRENLTRLIGEGASLVAFSGGKAIGGPQASGILVGRRPLVASALLQQLDMDIDPRAFRPPPEFFANSAAPPLPRHGIGRGFKASKEAIVGLLVALDEFLARDEVASARALATRLQRIADGVAGVQGVATEMLAAGKPRAYPRLALRLDHDRAPVDARSLAARLAAQPTPVHLAEERIGEDVLIVDPSCLAPADDQRIVAAIRAALAQG